MIDFKKVLKINRVNDPGTLYVIKHIPKSAGTSLRMQIIEDYEPDEIFCFYNELVGKHCFMNEKDFHEKQKRYSDLDLKRVKILIGHMVNQRIALTFNRPVKYITIIREPAERLVSLYLHQLRSRYRRLDKSIAEIGEIEQTDLIRDFSFWFDHLYFSASLTHNLANFFKDKISRLQLYNEKNILQYALKALESFDCLGIIEENETFRNIESMLKLTQNVGFYNQGEYSKNQHLYEFAKIKILEKWPLDFELYQHARKLKK